ncbi:hypothetical protein DQ244_11770 [Blastococcus sp. TBT05-19]|uniref:hypothetical protein n=1 Tax=Blastococcus sp. TBT05-19 TaxID=2250581 RepID=UPI000DEB74D1|nr:hypothetical protein [Blastococcus sp. TBT05-19]RBY90143.1 hypothetical protein DQ244_11770 [Blastococcus sp. TBT05-19]
MLLWIALAVAVVALVALAVLVHGVVGGMGRLRRELEAGQRDLGPVLEQVQATVAAAERTKAQREARANER